MCLQAVGAPFFGVTACLLHNERTRDEQRQGGGRQGPSRGESEPEQGVESVGVDAKPSDLHLATLKFR